MSVFAYPFMRHAFVAGTAIALAVGLVGYFVVLRKQTFTGDALSHVAFTGTLGALVLGVDGRVGLFVAVVAVAVLLGAVGAGRADDVTIGAVFAWVLGVGVLCLSLFSHGHATADSSAGVNALFGSIFGLDAGRAYVAAAVALAIVAGIVTLARPLLFSTVDIAVAAARGVPTRALGYAFLLLVGLAAAEATQAVGALLLLGLLAGPAAAAQRLTARPYRGLALSGAIAVGCTWAGLLLAYAVPRVPPSTAIIAMVVAVYAAASITTR